MSVTAVIPSGTLPLYAPMVVALDISDVGDGVTTQKRIAYQLKTKHGDEITPIEVITSPKPDTIYVDFHKDIIPYIFTAVPEIGGGWTARNAQEMLIGIELFIGEYVTDLEECTTEGELTSAGDWEVLNTAFQPYESPADLSAYTTLTHQPRSTWQWREAANYLCFWQNIGGGTISTALDSVSASTPFNVNMVYFALHNLGLSDEATTPFIKFENMTGFDYTVHLRDSCIQGVEFANIMFLDSLGGRSAMSFEVIDSKDVQVSYDTFNRLNPFGGIPDQPGGQHSYYTVGNQSILNKQTLTKVTLIRDAENNKEHHEWFKAFLASGGYHIQVKNYRGFWEWHKFIVESGQTQYAGEDEIDFVVTGYMVPYYNNHTTDV